jgi:hypothetical protein
MAGEYSVHLDSGLTINALVFNRDRGQIWNGSAFVNVSAVTDAQYASYAISCPEETTSDATGTGRYVCDRPSGLTSAATYLVEFYSGSPTPGAQNWGIQFDEYGGSTPSGSVTAGALKAEVGDYLGVGRSGWSADQETRLDKIILSGRNQFYWPPPLDGSGRISQNGKVHRWTFLRPAATFDMVVDQYDYDCPAGFGGTIGGKLYYDKDEDVWTPIHQRSYGEILALKQRDPSSGIPLFYAEIPKTSDGSSEQLWQISFDKPPDDTYTIRYQYQITPSSIGSTYNLGGDKHYETCLASCLAIAEQRYEELDTSRRMFRYWQERLAASVAYDKTQSPIRLGVMRDPSQDKAIYKRSSYVTFDGTLYDNT